MAKGQKRSSREKKKPKAAVKKTAADTGVAHFQTWAKPHSSKTKDK